MYEKKQLFYAFTAVLPLCGFILGLTSCSNSENTTVVENNSVKGLVGTFYQVYDVQGSLDSVIANTSLPHKYSRVVDVYEFRDNGTGIWNRYFFDDEGSEPFADLGGGSGGLGSFKYSTLADGKVNISLEKFSEAPSVKPYSPTKRTLHFSDSLLNAEGLDGEKLYLNKDNGSWEATFDEWNKLLHGGASADNYNINDVDFTQSNWRDQEAIYIYDGVGMDATDAKNRSGYTLVNLPWYEGPKSVNLPEGFTDNITPENGWEWVMNLCGSRGSTNNNFFAVYNKYTGILRFFYYMPNNYNTGNDHVWQVSMTDQLAQSSTIRYGLPLDRKIVDKAAIDQVGKGTIVEYITPWVDYLSKDGLIMPNVGWWSFDVDFSVYRNINTSSSENIRLQMRTWNVEHASLSSTLSANIDGSIKANINLLKSQHINNSVLGYLGMLGNMGGSIIGAISKFKEGKTGEGISSVINFGKTTANLFGIKTNPSEDINGSMDGTINLAMNGTINTQGFIEYAKAAVGVAAPTMQWKDFRKKGSHIGEGIWNIESAPVVYYTDGYVDWKTEDYWTESTWYDTEENKLPPKTGKFQHVRKYTRNLSPFGGMMPDLSTSKKPHYGHITFFDPSSIKLKLNPNVFTPEEIETAKVYAICGVRKSVKYGETESYRKAQGLNGSEFKVDDTYSYFNRPFTEAPFDALSGSEDKMGLLSAKTFAAQTYNKASYGLFGRGDNDYLIEPQYLSNGTGYNTMPPYEVTVTVVVTHDGKPMVYSRTYLPEYKFMSLTQMGAEIDRIKDEKPDAYDDSLYTDQVAHISDVMKWSQRTLHPTYGTPYEAYHAYITQGEDGRTWGYALFNFSQRGEKPEASFANLFDGNTQSEWLSLYIWTFKSGGWSVANGKEVWFAEFETHFPITPKSWTLWNGVYGNISERNPSHVILYGKKKQNDSWVMLDNEHPSIYMPTSHGNVTKGFNTNQPEDMQYFRLEVLGNYGDPVLGLSEFTFNFND